MKQSFLCEKEFEKRNDWFCDVQFTSIIKQKKKNFYQRITTSGMYILVYIVYASYNRIKPLKVLNILKL